MNPRSPLLLGGMLVVSLGAAWWLSGSLDSGRAVGLDGPSVGARPAFDEGPASLRRTGESSKADRTLGADDHAETVVAQGGPRGRVVSLTSGSGVGGVRVRLFRGGEPVEHAITALDGAFAFDTPGATGDWVEAGPDSRFHFEPERHAISRTEEGRGSVELFLGVRRLPSGPATGLVVDERTGEPVPHYQLWIHDGVGTDDGMRSGDDGRFRGDQVLVPGLRRIIGVDSTTYGGTAHEQRLEVTDPNEPLRIEVPVGPTYSLLLALPEGRRIEGFLAQLRRVGATAPPSEQPTGVTRVRGGKLPWVRLALDSTPTGTGTESDHELHLVSEDGLLSGRAAVFSSIGIQSEPIAIELQPSGVLRGRVLDREGDVPHNPRVTLEGIARSSRFEVVPIDGNFRIPGLEPGDYLLKVHGRGIEPYRRPISIQAEEATVIVCRVKRRALVHSLAGVLRCRSGLPMNGIEVELADQFDEAWPASLHWAEDSIPAYATFTADRLPRGVYTPRVKWSRGSLTSRCVPSTAAAWPRGDPKDPAFEIEVDDPPRGGPLRVELQAVATGLPLSGTVEVLGPGWALTSPCIQGVAHFESVPADARTWAVLATTRQHGITGAPGTLARGMGGGERTMSIAFPVGRQTALRVASDGSPLAGVRLLLDGETSAPSDGWGYVFHRGPLPPRRVSMDEPGWTLDASTHLDPGTGRLLTKPMDVVRVTVTPAQDPR